MLIPKKNRLAVYSYLFKEGVVVCKKALVMTKHLQIEVPNIHVVKLMQSLKSRGHVKEQFNWQYLYYTLTDEGIEYLRNYLHVSEDTVPATLKKATKPQPPPSFGRRTEDEDGGRRGGRGGFRGGRGGRGGREGYRGPKDFEGGAPRGFNPEFEGGRGGGRGGSRGGRGGVRGGRGGSSE
jgi:small subunit ribosomal protein S10e